MNPSEYYPFDPAFEEYGEHMLADIVWY